MDICKQKDDMNIVVVGHVDHGKSTVIGRMLADTNSLPEGKLEQVRENCRRNSKPFEYAFLLDALKDEQAQGITIDSARCFFGTEKRNYIIIDAPGHIEFLKNMVTGAARAEAALLVIDANEGVMENSTRHGYLLSMLGIKQVAVVVNKMDLVDYSEEIFNRIVMEYSEFLKKINITASSFIPVSGMMGDNVALKDGSTPWYKGMTVLEQLDDFKGEGTPEDMPFRMPVQDIYKFTKNNDDRRIIAGTVTSGKVSANDYVVFYPSGKSSGIKSIESFNTVKKTEGVTGEAIGFTLKDQIYITRGELAAVENEPQPSVARRIKANIFWLGKKPLNPKSDYLLKSGAAKISCKLESVVRVLNASNLNTSEKEVVERHEVAECIFSLAKPLAFDVAALNPLTSRFVLIDEYEISGGGIITDDLPDEFSDIQEQVMARNIHWNKSSIGREQRAIRYKQKPSIIVITGSRDSGKKPLARALEKKLFDNGEMVYFMSMGSIVYGIDADIKSESDNNREEHIRRVGEVINLMLDTGMILILTAIELTAFDMELIETISNPAGLLKVWTGGRVTTDIKCDLVYRGSNIEKQISEIIAKLAEKGVIFGIV